MARVSGFWKKVGSAIEPAIQGGADLLISGIDRYLNFGTDSGDTGYGIRDNAGVLQFKNSAGSWTNFGAGGGGSGDVVGPASATDNAVARFDTTTGKLIQGSDLILEDDETMKFPAGAGGLQFYNTADQVTNWERGVFRWSSNILEIGAQRNGTGLDRQVNLIGNGGVFTINSSGTFDMNRSTGSSAINIVSVGGTQTNSSGITQGLRIVPTINQSGTAGYTGLLINPTETTTGSGVKRLISTQVGSSDRFVLLNTGEASFYSQAATQEFSIGRNANERIRFYVDDGDGLLEYRQDETGTEAHNFNFNITSAATGNQSYAFKNNNVTIVNITKTGATTFSGEVTVPDEAYDATSWNANLEVPTKNAIRDKIETLTLPNEYFIAANDATAREKARADYLCDGTADEVQINTALDLIRATGGTVRLSSGTFAIAASINMLGNVAEADDNPFMQLFGTGSESTTLTGGSNINVISTGQRAKYEIAYFTAVASGSGDCISQTAGTERGNWQSWIHDVYLQGNFVNHTGWGLDMQSPFRMRFENIEMNGVANGARFTCQTNSFNPGNITVDRMFIDLWNDASNASAKGFELSVLNSTATGVMNLVSVNRLDIAGGSNLTSSIGIHIVGATASYGDSRHHTFTSLNIEDIKTVIKMERGRDCSFNDINYSRVLSGGTFIELDSTSHNNSFENAYVVAQGSSQTFNLIVDSNGSSNLPNRLIRVDGFQPSTTTINAALASNTILESIDLSGGSPTIDADITNRNNVRTFADVLVTDEAYGVGWNGSLEVPTKNALYDKIETITGASGISEELAIAYAVSL